MISQRKQGYDLHSLSEDEKNRFTEALGDGFGHSHRNMQLAGLNLPTEVKSGLLEHRAFYENSVLSDSEEEYEEDEFWVEPDDDSPPGLFEQCPLNFHMPTIRSYFAEQKKAYLSYMGTTEKHSWISDLKSEDLELWEYQIYREALYETYSKAWYEFHINQKINWCDETVAMLYGHAKKGSPLGMSASFLLKFSVQLGRLIEQYYWKFFIEKSAVRGRKIAESAKNGGHILASIRRAEHSRWQSAANLIWRERPTISNMAVATILKKRLSVSQSVKHIARVLKR